MSKAIDNTITLDNPKRTSLWSDAYKRLLKNKLAIFGLIAISAIALFAIVGPWLAPYSQEQTNLELGASAPSWAHWLGTDTLGRDLLVRIMQGTRVSLLVGFVASMVSLIIGSIYGAMAGYFGGRTDMIMMRIVDILYCLPFMFLVIILVVIAGRSLLNLFIALGAIQWLTLSRITRGQVLSLKEKEFVESARALGLPKSRIILRHILPNALGPIIVYTTLTIPAVMLEEAFLSFLGLGVQAPQASLGSLVTEGAEVMQFYSWMLLFPGGILSLCLMSLNFLGDGLRDALDPQLKKS